MVTYVVFTHVCDGQHGSIHDDFLLLGRIALAIAAYCYTRSVVGRSLAWFVCLLVKFVSHAKTAEPIEMPFVCHRNHVGLSDGASILLGKTQLCEEGREKWRLVVSTERRSNSSSA